MSPAAALSSHEEDWQCLSRAEQVFKSAALEVYVSSGDLSVIKIDGLRHVKRIDSHSQTFA